LYFGGTGSCPSAPLLYSAPYHHPEGVLSSNSVILSGGERCVRFCRNVWPSRSRRTCVAPSSDCVATEACRRERPVCPALLKENGSRRGNLPVEKVGPSTALGRSFPEIGSSSPRSAQDDGAFFYFAEVAPKNMEARAAFLSRRDNGSVAGGRASRRAAPPVTAKKATASWRDAMIPPLRRQLKEKRLQNRLVPARRETPREWAPVRTRPRPDYQAAPA